MNYWHDNVDIEAACSGCGSSAGKHRNKDGACPYTDSSGGYSSTMKFEKVVAPGFEIVCANCGNFRGNHSTNELGIRCMGKYGSWSDTSFFSPVEENTVFDEPLNILCKNCGHRSGEHSSVAKKCPIFDNPSAEWCMGFHETSKFQPTNPPQYKPKGWKPSKELTAALQVPEPNIVTGKKKMKTPKPWDQKLEFKTAKEPKAGLTYYKEVPVPPLKNACAEIEVEDFLAIPESTIQALKYYQKMDSHPYYLSTPSKTTEVKPLSKQDILNAVESLKGISVSGSMMMHHQKFFGRGVRDVIEPELPIEVLAEAYLRSHAPDKTLVQMLVGFAQSAENPAVRRLADEVTRLNRKLESGENYNARLTRQRDEWHREWKTRGREIEALQDQMAGMVPKAVAKVPRGVEGNARKFRDA